MIEYIYADGSSSGDVESLSGEERSSVEDGLFGYNEISSTGGGIGLTGIEDCVNALVQVLEDNF